MTTKISNPSKYYTAPKIALESIDELIGEKINIIFVIVDYKIPKMMGVEFECSVKSRHPILKCVMLSGQANKISLEELQNDQLLETFIGKLWDEEVLFNTLHLFFCELFLTLQHENDYFSFFSCLYQFGIFSKRNK